MRWWRPRRRTEFSDRFGVTGTHGSQSHRPGSAGTVAASGSRTCSRGFSLPATRGSNQHPSRKTVSRIGSRAASHLNFILRGGLKERETRGYPARTPCRGIPSRLPLLANALLEPTKTTVHSVSVLVSQPPGPRREGASGDVGLEPDAPSLLGPAQFDNSPRTRSSGSRRPLPARPPLQTARLIDSRRARWFCRRSPLRGLPVLEAKLRLQVGFFV